MSRAPLYALTAAVSLIAAVLSVSSPAPPATAEVPPAPPLSTEVPSTGYVLAGAVEASALSEFEAQLTEEAASRATSTSTTTTTTVEPPVAQPAQAAGQDSEPSSTPTTIPVTTTTVQAGEEPTGGFDSAAESQFASKINSLRSSDGKQALTRDGSLDARARDWSKHMAENGSLSHSNLSSLMPPWTSVGENVGAGGSVSEVFSLLESSSGHRSNMLGDFTHMGIGVWRDASGTLWTTHVFARA